MKKLEEYISSMWKNVINGRTIISGLEEMIEKYYINNPKGKGVIVGEIRADYNEVMDLVSLK